MQLERVSARTAQTMRNVIPLTPTLSPSRGAEIPVRVMVAAARAAVLLRRDLLARPFSGGV
ncbi:MAG: hypothetical protein ACXWVP_11095, partial [Burkholderiales bacterium]